MGYVATAGDIVRCTLAVMYPDSQLEETNLGLQCAAPGAGAANYLQLLATQVYNTMHARYGVFVPSNANFLGCKVVTELPHPSPSPGIYSVTVAGGGAPLSAPTQARPILRLTTDRVGRRWRGRLYMFTPDTTYVTATGFPAGGIATNLNLWLADLLLGFNPTAGALWMPVIVHRVTAHNPVLFATLVTGGSPAPGFGTQRRSGNTGRVNTAPW